MDKLTEEGEAESFTISATGMDMKSVTQNLIAAVSGTPVPTGVSFDIKA
jgi:dUTPase